MKALVLISAMVLGSVANAGWFSSEKQERCFASLSSIQRASYTCEFGKVVRIRESRGSDRDNNRGSRGCKEGRGGNRGGRN